MAYPEKPTGNYTLRDYNFAQADSKKIPMDEYLFKNGYKNAEESDTESVPDAHNQNWLFDILHRNLKYAVDTAEENKRLLSNIKTPVSDIVSGSTNPLTSGGAYTYLVRRASTTTGTGSVVQPVYVKADGQIAICNTMVDTTTNQNISGTKTFNSVITFNSTINGNINGNAGTATKATGDKNGLDIAVNYVKRASTTSATGSASQGVYIDANGKVVACNAVSSIYSSTSNAPINGKGVLEMLKLIYPVGAIYLGLTSECPLSTLFGTWEKLPSDLVLQTAGTWNAGTEIPQALPDHKHTTSTQSVCVPGAIFGGMGTSATYGSVTTKYASDDNSIYTGNRVQPPAIALNAWKRTA